MVRSLRGIKARGIGPLGRVRASEQWEASGRWKKTYRGATGQIGALGALAAAFLHRAGEGSGAGRRQIKKSLWALQGGKKEKNDSVT
jgi:hypothetical protein